MKEKMKYRANLGLRLPDICRAGIAK